MQQGSTASKMSAKKSSMQPRIRTKLGSLLILLISGVATGVLWQQARGPQSATGVIQNTRETPSPSAKVVAISSGPSIDQPNATSVVTTEVPDDVTEDERPDLTATSWLNPFDPRYWTFEGWELSSEGMLSRNERSAIATFGRPYRRLRLEADIQPLDEVGPFELRLHCEQTGSQTVIRFDGVIEVVEVRDGQRRAIEQSGGELGFQLGRKSSVQIAATGNRLQVAINGRRKLSCDQPVAQSGREVSITLASETSAWRITRLRIEGE